MSNTAYLSKSTYIRGLQCEKSLYLHKKMPQLRDKVGERQQAIFDQGTNTGVLAQQLFPRGKDCSFTDFSQINQCIQDTTSFIEQGEAVIYEAAFRYDNILVFADILVNDKVGWKVFEVKSSTSVKEAHINDAALQAYVINNCGLELKDISIVHINNQYVRNGDIEVDRLFAIASVKEQAKERMPLVPKEIGRLRKVLALDHVPEKQIGMHCEDPYPCDFMGHCWKGVPEDSVFSLSKLHGKKKFQLYHDGYERLVEIPEDYKLSERQKMQIEGVRTGASHVDDEKINEFIASLNYPLYFLDFETINPAVPLYDHSRPYEQIPFQYSLHIQNEPDGELIHKQYLAETDGTDPRINFIQRLIEDCGNHGDVIVYNKGFESGRINGLATSFSQYAKELQAINARLVDLMIPFQKGWYYIPEMKGSYSIKKVLPALVPELSYKDLEIGDGGTASRIFEAMAAGTFQGDYEKTRADLVKYCELDTLAMVKILNKLKLI